MALRGSYYGGTSGIFYLTSVRCSGSESRLVDCSYTALALASCGDGDYAGVQCLGKLKVLN